MRKLAILLGAGAVFFALVAFAVASVTPTVTYTSPITQKAKPRPGKPANITYKGILDVRNSDGTQPDTAPTTTIYFAKGFVNNAKHFPSCSASDIDGKPAIPAKCRKALVGSGTATSNAGTPGTPSRIVENLSVQAYNAAHGKQVLLVLNASTPVPIQNRVIPGVLGRARGKWAYKVTFTVPPDLRQQLTLQIALTHFDVTFPASKTVTAKVHGKRQKVSYLQLSKCPKSKKLPVQAIVNFYNDAGQPGGPTVTAKSTTRCR